MRQEPYVLNDNEVPEYDFEKRGRMIHIAHRLVGMTCLDDEELQQEMQRLTKNQFNRREIADIVRFAAIVARGQAEQLESLPEFSDFYRPAVNREISQ
jgi:hypothetical protein